MYASATQAPIETKNPRVNLLVTKWQHVWLLALERRRKLNDALDRLEEVIQYPDLLSVSLQAHFCCEYVLSWSFHVIIPCHHIFSRAVEGICQL